MVFVFQSGTDGQRELALRALRAMKLPLESKYERTVIVNFVANPGGPSTFEYASTYPDADVIGRHHIDIREDYGRIGGETDLFDGEVFVHEMGHVMYGHIAEYDPDVLEAVWALWGVGSDEEWSPPGDEDDPNAWMNSPNESFAETFKEAFLPAEFRAFANRTNVKLPYWKYPEFRRLIRNTNFGPMTAYAKIDTVPDHPENLLITKVPAYDIDMTRVAYSELGLFGRDGFGMEAVSVSGSPENDALSESTLDRTGGVAKIGDQLLYETLYARPSVYDNDALDAASTDQNEFLVPPNYADLPLSRVANGPDGYPGDEDAEPVRIATPIIVRIGHRVHWRVPLPDPGNPQHPWARTIEELSENSRSWVEVEVGTFQSHRQYGYWYGEWAFHEGGGDDLLLEKIGDAEDWGYPGPIVAEGECVVTGPDPYLSHNDKYSTLYFRMNIRFDSTSTDDYPSDNPGGGGQYETPTIDGWRHWLIEQMGSGQHPAVLVTDEITVNKDDPIVISPGSVSVGADTGGSRPRRQPISGHEPYESQVVPLLPAGLLLTNP